MVITNEKQLREIYGYPKGRAKDKDIGLLDKHSLNFIRKSPFLILSTCGQSGTLDASPRGGSPGFVKTDDNRLYIPDFKGNNRIDSLVNISETGQAGLLFMIPGIDETLRVNGTAIISTEQEILKLFAEESRPPISCIVVEVVELFLHCAKAFMRSKLWDPNSQIDSGTFPSIGEMLKEQLKDEKPAESRKDMIKRYESDI